MERLDPEKIIEYKKYSIAVFPLGLTAFKKLNKKTLNSKEFNLLLFQFQDFQFLQNYLKHF